MRGKREKKATTVEADSLYTNREVDLKGKTCAIYARVSSKSQLQGLSIETQIEKCKEFANHNDMIVKNEYSEDASARYPNKRKIFENMVKAQSTSDKVDVIVFLMVDRMSRNPVDSYKLLQMVEKKGLILVFVQEGLVLKHPIKADQELVLDMVMGVSKYRVNHDRDVCMLGLTKSAKSGFRPCKAPYGYRNDKNRRKAVISKSEAEFVRAAFEMYATGEYTLSSLPAALLQDGYKYQLQPDKIIPKASLASMLKNTFYTGKYQYSDIEGLLKGNHNGIISDELYDKVQSVLGEPPLEIKRYKHFYSKLLKCEICGYHMIGDTKIKPNGKEYTYYRCMNPQCNSFGGINQNDVNTAVERYLNEIRLDQIPKEIITNTLKETLSELVQKKSTLRRGRSRKYHAELKTKEFIENNEICDDDWSEETFSQIEEKYKDTDEELQKIEEKILNIEHTIKEIFTKRLSDVYENLPDDAKIKILSLINNKFTIKDKKVKMTFKSAFRKIRKR